MSSVTLVLVSAISLSFGAVDYDGCQFNLTDTNGITAEYDLSWFHLRNEVFRVVDVQNTYFEYAFNICGALQPSIFHDNQTIPTECAQPHTNHGPCIKIDDVDGNPVPQCDVANAGFENTAGYTPSAVQIDTLDPNETRCYWLGMEIKVTDGLPEYNMELLDPDDAGKGVVFTILNGEWCESVGRNRELRIELECPDDQRIEFVPSFHKQQISEATVEEIDTCVYQLAVKSPNACPNKCVSRLNMDMFAVCATHGICESDPYGNGEDKYPNGTLRCLCDDGYTGVKCEQQYNEIRIIEQNHPGLFTAIVICIILLGVAIVLAAVLCHKIRMRELVESDSMHHLAGGMLSDENEATLAQRKQEAVSMNIGSGMPATAVQLQTVDDQMEKDKAEDHRNALLVDEEEEEQQIVVEEEEEEEVEVPQNKEEVIDEATDGTPDAVVGVEEEVGVVVDVDEEEEDTGDVDDNDDVGPNEETTDQAQQDEDNDGTNDDGDNE